MRNWYDYAATRAATNCRDSLGDADYSTGLASFEGLLGERLRNTMENRLKPIVGHPYFVEGFQKKAGAFPWKRVPDPSTTSWEGSFSVAWQGEHIGKWLHTATIVSQATGDDQLAALVTDTTDALVACQEPDGYLGTYAPESRFVAPDGPHAARSWDVWTHRYVLYGLLEAYRCFGRESWLEASVRVGDLLSSVFGPDGTKCLVFEGTRRGLSALTLVESVMKLYFASGEERFLDFARYLLYEASEKRTKVFSRLLEGRGVTSIGDGKAYQLMAVLLGMLDLYRAAPDRDLLYAVKAAWSEIQRHHLHVTGGPWSQAWNDVANRECFAPAELWSPQAGVEICSTTTWIQLCASLHGLTGEAVYVDELEKALLNHLFGSVTPDCSEGAYFTSPNSKGHEFNSNLHCCNSSAPRGLAVAATTAYSVSPEGVSVNLYGESRFSVRLNGGKITLIQDSRYPSDGRTQIRIEAEGPSTFSMSLRIPAWVHRPRVLVNDTAQEGVKPGAYFVVDREWRQGDTVEVDFPFYLESEQKTWGGQDIRAYSYGPLVLAAARDVQEDTGAIPEVDGTDRGSVLPTPTDTQAAEFPCFRLPGGSRDFDLEPYFVASSRKRGVATWFRMPD